MKVYVLYENYEIDDGACGKSLIGVFDSEELANEEIAKLPKEERGRNLDYRIEEFDLNKGERSYGK